MAKSGYTIQINKKGETALKDIVGFGGSCLEATKKIEKILGGAKENTRQFTDEYEDELTNDLSQEI